MEGLLYGTWHIKFPNILIMVLGKQVFISVLNRFFMVWDEQAGWQGWGVRYVPYSNQPTEIVIHMPLCQS